MIHKFQLYSIMNLLIGAEQMKKIMASIILAGIVAGSSFGAGLSQLELAELLVNKAKAENLIEQKDYTDEEIITFVETYGMMEITEASKEVDVSVVRQVLADYDKNKLAISTVDGEPIDVMDMNEAQQYAYLEEQNRVLSHEFMKTMGDERDFTNELGNFALDGESFPTTDDDVYPLMNKYRYELYRIFGWYAKEYNLYVHQTPASVGLYNDKRDILHQVDPLINVGFLDNPQDLNDDGVAYSVRMKVIRLYNVDYIEGETLAESRERVVATGFKQPYLVMALKDASSLFIKDKNELEAFTNSFVNDVVENEDKEYSYEKLRHEIFGENRYWIAKLQGQVFYNLDFDLSKWEE